MFYAVLLVLEKLFLLKWLKKLPKVLCHIYAIFTVMMGWTLFFFEDMKALGAFFVRLFTPAATGAEGLNLVLGFLPLMLVAILASTPAAKALFARHEDKAIVRWGRIVVSAVLLLLCVAALASQSYNPFIYFRF